MGKASRKKQGNFAGVDGEGRPLFPDTTAAPGQVAGVPLTWLLAILAVAFWVGAHLLGTYSYLAGAGYLIAGIGLGLLNPGLGAAIAIALVPFFGGEMSQGLGEFVRSAPILGSAIRLLYDRFAHRASRSSGWAPDVRIVVAAIIVMILYPLTRVTANGLDGSPSTTLFDDLLFLCGAPVAMYATWITISHLPRAAVNRILEMLPYALAAALIVAIGAWAGVTLLDPFAFAGTVYGRLAALGFPTPTGMGIAIALPLSIGVLWSRSRRAALLLTAIGLGTIFLTQSRGPLIAVIAGAVVVVLQQRVPRKYLLGLALLGVLVVSALLLWRYPDLVRKLAHGRLPKLPGDQYRVTSWFAGIQIALEHPLTGGGWMSVRHWNDGQLMRNGVNHSHNIVLQALADGGFLLGGAVAVVIISSLRGAWARRHQIPAYWVGAAVTLIVCGLWDLPQLRAYAAVMGGLVLGLVARGAEHGTDVE